MRDILIIFGICVASIVIGVALYMNGVGTTRSIPDLNQQETPAETSVEPGKIGPVSFMILAQGARAAGVSERKNYAVRDEESFATLWEKAHGNEGDALPEVNFDEYQVVGVFAGVRTSGGYSISVVEVEDTIDERIITIAITSPGEGCMVSQVLTNPYQLIRLPASSLPLTREYVEEVRPCN